MQMSNKFVEIELNNNTIPEYIVRTLLFTSLKKKVHLFSGNILDVGCGEMPYKTYILDANKNVISYLGIDLPSNEIRDTQIADKVWDGKIIPFEDNSFETVICTEVLEHCFDPETILSEVYRVLKKGGVAYFTTPFAYPIHEAPFDAYRYTPYGLRYLFNKIQFREIQIEALGGWESSMAQLIALWYTKRKYKLIKHRISLFVVKKILSFLLKRDEPLTVLGDNEISLGFSTIVKK